MTPHPKKMRPRMVAALMETFGLSPRVAFAVSGVLIVLGLLVLTWFIRSAPPRELTITSGPPDSSFERYAKRYQKEMAGAGVTLRIVPSQGSRENLQRLAATHPKVDIGLVQGGVSDSIDLTNVVSLGSVAFQPLWVFCRAQPAITRLAELSGRRIAIGPLGSGTHTLALALLHLNEIEPGGNTALVDLEADAAATALLQGKVDAVFLAGDSAPIAVLIELIRSPDVRMLDFRQADAYARRLGYLSTIVLPEGSIDLGKDLPPHDVTLIGTTVELVAHRGLHPALSDLLIETAQKVHGQAGLLQRQGQFPAPLEHEFTISDDATRYYKSGKKFINGLVQSFWLASLLNRILVVFVPTLLVMIPTVRLVPVAYRWRLQLRIYRYYRLLLVLEREASETRDPAPREALRKRLDEINADVNRLKLPASFAVQFYDLRQHVIFVRDRLGLHPK